MSENFSFSDDSSKTSEDSINHYERLNIQNLITQGGIVIVEDAFMPSRTTKINR